MFVKLKRMIYKRNFITLIKGKSFGFAECYYKFNFFYYGNIIDFQEITNIPLNNNKERVKLSISLLSEEERNDLIDTIHKRIPIRIYFKYNLIGSPFKGNILFPCYITKFEKNVDT